MKSDDALIGSWAPGIGDPSFGGWLTVALYLFAAYQCFVVARGSRAGRERRIWQILLVGLAALGINKQLDLQTALTEIGRIFAHRGGWYESRHLVQRAFIGIVAVLGLLGSLSFFVATRGLHRSTQLAVCGAVGLVAFVVIRAASFHHVDLFIHAELLGVRMNWLFEMGGILIVMVAARWRRGVAR